jgi:hypothetical protein
MNFAAITLCVASQQVFIVVYFFIDSVRKLLDTPAYFEGQGPFSMGPESDYVDRDFMVFPSPSNQMS